MHRSLLVYKSIKLFSLFLTIVEARAVTLTNELNYWTVHEAIFLENFPIDKFLVEMEIIRAKIALFVASKWQQLTVHKLH